MTYEPPTQPYNVPPQGPTSNVPPQGPSGLPPAPAGQLPEPPKKKANVRAVGVATALVLAGGAAVYGYTQQAQRDEAGNITEGGNVSVDDLRVGDCLPTFGEGEVTSVDAVPCSEPHEAEVYYTFTITGFATFPGDAALEELSDKCVDPLFEYAPTVAETDESLGIGYMTPTAGSWAQGDRVFTCIATFDQRTGSIKE